MNTSLVNDQDLRRTERGVNIEGGKKGNIQTLVSGNEGMEATMTSNQKNNKRSYY